MKKIMLALGLMFATLTLTNCSQEFDENITPDNAQKTFAVTANIPATRTSIDGMETSWVAGDKIALFYNDNYAGIYTNSAADLDRFEGTEPTLDDTTAYTWYALYPANFKESSGSITDYNSGRKPTNTAYDNVGYQSVDQDGYNSTAHVCNDKAPLWGKTTTEAGTTSVSFTMKHLCSMLAIEVTNAQSEEIIITGASFTSDKHDFVGTYNLNLTGDEVGYTASGASYVFQTASVNVKNGATLKNGEKATLYLPIKPFSTTENEKLTLAVQTNKGNVEKTITCPATAIKFTAGNIKTLTIAVEEVKSNLISLPWNENFDSNDLSKYILTNGGTDTKYFAEKQAGGTSAGELLISKSNGAMTINFASDRTAKTLYLTFNTNYSDRISISSVTTGVSITNNGTTSKFGRYIVTIPEGLDSFDLTLKNTTGSNVRIDNIRLAETAFIRSLVSISIASATDTYTIGETYSFDGKVVATYDDTTTAEVEGYDLDSTLVDTAKAGKYEVTVSYTENGITKTATYTVTVKDSSAVETKVTISYSDFTTSSYANNNGTHTKDDISYYTNQVYQGNGSVMQWHKNNAYLYNTTDLGKIKTIVIKTISSGSFTVYAGTASKPSTTKITGTQSNSDYTYDFSTGEYGYFQIKVGGATGKLKSIEITYEK